MPVGLRASPAWSSCSPVSCRTQPGSCSARLALMSSTWRQTTTTTGSRTATISFNTPSETTTVSALIYEEAVSYCTVAANRFVCVSQLPLVPGSMRMRCVLRQSCGARADQLTLRSVSCSSSSCSCTLRIISPLNARRVSATRRDRLRGSMRTPRRISSRVRSWGSSTAGRGSRQCKAMTARQDDECQQLHGLLTTRRHQYSPCCCARASSPT